MYSPKTVIMQVSLAQVAKTLKAKNSAPIIKIIDYSQQ